MHVDPRQAREGGGLVILEMYVKLPVYYWDPPAQRNEKLEEENYCKTNVISNITVSENK